MDGRAVQLLRPERTAGALSVRGNLGTRWRVAAAAGSVQPEHRRPQLGLDRGYRWEGPHRAGRRYRSVHAGKPGGLPGQGEGRLGAHPSALPDLEPGWA